MNFSQVLQAVLVLIGKGDVSAVCATESTAKVLEQTKALNRLLVDRARSSGEVSYLASPMTGGGVVVGRFQQLFLLSLSQGGKDADEWAAFAWKILSGQGLKIVKEGKELSSATENLSELTMQANDFAKRWMPIMRAVGIAPKA